MSVDKIFYREMKSCEKILFGNNVIGNLFEVMNSINRIYKRKIPNSLFTGNVTKILNTK